MKKFGKILTLALCGALALVTLAACGSTMGSIQKRFEADGWTVEQGATGGYAEIGSATFYTAKKEGKLIPAIMMELTAGSDFEKFISDLESDENVPETVKGIVKDAYKAATEAGLINGNCLFILGDDDAKELFKG